MSHLLQARERFHQQLKQDVLRLDKRMPSIADKDNRASRDIAASIFQQMGVPAEGPKLQGQTAGSQFEWATACFLRETFPALGHVRPGEWQIVKIGEKQGVKLPATIADFDQYHHLNAITQAASDHPELAASLGTDYIIKPDIVIYREPLSDDAINGGRSLIDGRVAGHTRLRQANGGKPLLHASISCKLTIRSDRSQNARSEALNLIRNRRGNLPHIAVVTAEPLPSRLASVALGSADIDCLYHFALPELQHAVHDLQLADAEDMVGIMVQGKRLRDITDLPLDLAV